jgi:hypothetical protein
VGLGAGVGTLEASAALTGLYNLAAVSLWKWHTSQPVIAEIALGEQKVPEGQTVLETLTKEGGHRPGERHPKPAAEWLAPAETVSLDDQAPKTEPNGNKREGVLRVHAADDVPTRQLVEEILESLTKRWELETDDPGPDNLPTLTYSIRLKKRISPDDLLQALREQLGPELAEYTPKQPAGNGTPETG